MGSFYSQELVKKKEEVDRLNKELNKMMEESHERYLSYESQIVELEIKEKQSNSKINSLERDLKEIEEKLS